MPKAPPSIEFVVISRATLKSELTLEHPGSRPRLRRKSLIQIDLDQRTAIAAKTTYIGSPEHKIPHLRSDATPCPVELEGEQSKLTEWLRQAITTGHIGGILEGEFPRYAWYRDGDQTFEARLTNRAMGEYKGYPISREELPKELQ